METTPIAEPLGKSANCFAELEQLRSPLPKVAQISPLLVAQSRNLVKILDYDQLVQAVTATFLTETEADVCALALWSKADRGWVRSVSYRQEQNSCPLRRPLDDFAELPTQLLQWSYSERQHLLCQPHRYDHLPEPCWQYYRPHSAWVLPLYRDADCIGVLYLEKSHQSFSLEQQQAVDFLLGYAAIALAQGKNHQQLQTAYEQSKRAHEQSIRLFEAASDAILIHTEDQVIDCNPAALKLFGMSREEFLATNPAQLSPTYQADGSASASHPPVVFGTLMKQGYHRFEWQHQRPNGEVFWAEICMTLLPQDGGNLLHCVVRDIGDRKEVEAALRRTNLDLQEATRMKDEFLANMSHELRTPLNAILGLTESLQEQLLGPMTGRQLQALRTVESSGRHLLALITDILDLSKMAAGKMELELTPVVVASLCHDSLNFVRQQARNKSIDLQLEIPTLAGRISADERRLRQVLINLLSNAVKFTPPGGRVTLRVQHTDQGISFQVQDTGIGISAEEQSKLFRPFVQIDSRLNRKYEGTGLGLALVKQIVELHGGHVWVRSTPGAGSCFSVALPAQLVAIEEPIDGMASYESIDLSPAVHRPQQPPLILLAEDNTANIQTISSYLTAKGYRLLSARNGHEAIAMAAKSRPQLILMDIQMPEMDGLEAIGKIRDHAEGAQVPIVALTALASEKDRTRCLEAGANDYLSKPVRLQQLNSTIQQWLQRSELN